MKEKTDLIFGFLKEVAAHNDREWFAAHRPQYEEARAAFEEMVGRLIPRIAMFDDSVAHLAVKDCTYRFYRDTRFSEDKSPYKLHFGAYVNACGKKSWHSGYYFHLQPGGCMLAGGAWCLPPKMLKAVRQSVVDEIEEFRSIVEADDFKAAFPVIGETRLKTLPKGIPEGFPLSRLYPAQGLFGVSRGGRRFLPWSGLAGTHGAGVPTDEALQRLHQLYHRRMRRRMKLNL